MGLLDLTAVELAGQIKSGKTTAVEAMEAVIANIDSKEEELNCYVTFDREAALSAAKEAQKKIEAGELTGPLAGVPIAIKDNMCTEGVLTTCSSKILGNFIPQFSSEAVKRIEEAGAVVIGKTNMGRLFEMHGFSHPSRACVNAEKVFHITKKEQSIISSHMWPLTFRHVPTCREAIIVCLADKYCAVVESMFRRSHAGAVVDGSVEVDGEEW